MSAVSNDKPTGFFAKHEVNFYTASAVVALAMGLFSLGVVISAMGTSPHWYYAYDLRIPLHQNLQEYNGPDSSTIPTEISNAPEIENALQYGAQVGGIALAPCILGFILFAVALAARHRAMKKQQERAEVASAPNCGIELNTTSQRLKYIGILLGFSIAAFSSGLMIGSSILLNYGVGHVQDLITQGRIDNPNACTYYTEVVEGPGTVCQHGYCHPQWIVQYHSTDDNFWDKLQSDWVDPTKSAMSGMIPVGLFGALGGGGLVAFAIFGRGVFSFISCIKSRCTKVESNEKLAGDDL